MKRYLGTLVLFVLLILTVAAITQLDNGNSTNASTLPRQNHASSTGR